ncbi:RES family NAD+ phosphorylase [Longimicrobium terrae]|uniref:RES domain-containing protein n=1 Tax=Longimicrobium terrae TaxID=1639882 RepID=A0A841H1F3_9BACT|nr:RES family NAD+ phosphorylase [Longimicrobium terrae]MBB4637548.1 hypothetical protein [Longimicrobium terrae]MBB6071945.1 hypothetical protein [Longimicrobium terrae]NNC30491.1 RES family NAD+ phosphorylase [Longimicrobium terrae]
MVIALPSKPPIVRIPSSRPLWRVHLAKLGALWYSVGRSNRFDDPAAEFGVLYVGESPEVAVLETLVRGSAQCVVDVREWNARAVSRIHLATDLNLLQFEGNRLPAFGIGAERAHAATYDECRALAAAVHASLPDVDGIQFRSRWDPSQLCWAVFGRATEKVKGADAPIPLRGSRLGDSILDNCEIQLV